MLVLAVHVEDAKANTSLCEVPTNRHLYGRQAIVVKNVGPRDNWQYIDSSRQAADCRNVGLGQCGATIDNRGLQDDGFLVRLGEASIARPWNYGGGRT
jgi:hypothetical protein